MNCPAERRLCFFQKLVQCKDAANCFVCDRMINDKFVRAVNGYCFQSSLDRPNRFPSDRKNWLMLSAALVEISAERSSVVALKARAPFLRMR